MPSDIVKEIEGSIKRLEYVRQRHYNTIGGAETVIACERAELALQRAREALRWIPCEERLPEKSGHYRVTRYRPEGGDPLMEAFFNAANKHWSHDGILAWMENPVPYTPEEK